MRDDRRSHCAPPNGAVVDAILRREPNVRPPTPSNSYHNSIATMDTIIDSDKENGVLSLSPPPHPPLSQIPPQQHQHLQYQYQQQQQNQQQQQDQRMTLISGHSDESLLITRKDLELLREQIVSSLRADLRHACNELRTASDMTRKNSYGNQTEL